MAISAGSHLYYTLSVASEVIVNGEPEIEIDVIEPSPEDLGGLSLEQARALIKQVCEEALMRQR